MRKQPERNKQHCAKKMTNIKMKLEQRDQK